MGAFTWSAVGRPVAPLPPLIFSLAAVGTPHYIKVLWTARPLAASDPGRDVPLAGLQDRARPDQTHAAGMLAIYNL